MYLVLTLLVIFQTALCAEAQQVAFNLAQDKHLELSDSRTVPFEKVISSNTEQLNTGVFTCENPGYYKFQVYSLTSLNKRLYLNVFLNSDKVATLWAYQYGAYAAAGNVIILHLNQHDTVQSIHNGNLNVTWFLAIDRVYKQYKTTNDYGLNTMDDAHVTITIDHAGNPFQVKSRGTSDMFGTENKIYTTFTGLQIGVPSQGSAFSAVVASHQKIPGGDSVKYDTVLVDTNSAYDKNTGIYTVPSSGVYAFSFFSSASLGQAVWQELYRNEVYVCSIFGKMENGYADAGNTVILHLEHGDHIQVKAQSTHINNIYGKSDQMYTSLTGYQLPAVTDSGPIVYFSAGLSESKMFFSPEKIVFDKVFSDNGTPKNYDHQTGEFTAPKNGTYEFNIHALAVYSKTVWLELYHNGRRTVSLYGKYHDGSAAAGNAAVIDMVAGDVVHIQAQQINVLFGAPAGIYCTFSGVLH